MPQPKWGCIVGCGSTAASCAISGIVPVFLALGGITAAASLATSN